MREYIVDLTEAKTWNDLIQAFNIGFVHRVGGEWNGNLDAFNDYLWWPEERPYRLIIQGWQRSTTILDRHLTWDGKQLGKVLDEILHDNSQIELVLT